MIDEEYPVADYLQVLQACAHGVMVDLDICSRNPTYGGFNSIGKLVSVLTEYRYLAKVNWIDDHSKDVLKKVIVQHSKTENPELVYGISKLISDFMIFGQKDIQSY